MEKISCPRNRKYKTETLSSDRAQDLKTRSSSHTEDPNPASQAMCSTKEKEERSLRVCLARSGVLGAQSLSRFICLPRKFQALALIIGQGGREKEEEEKKKKKKHHRRHTPPSALLIRHVEAEICSPSLFFFFFFVYERTARRQTTSQPLQYA